MSASRLDVLYEDNHLLVVNKPAGLATMGVAAGDESLWQRCRVYLKQKYSKPGNVFLGIVSRIDAAVSGVIVFAKTSKAAARLSQQFRDGVATKVYWALVGGDREPPLSCELEHWLRKQESAKRMVASATPRIGGKKAALSFRKLNALDKSTWLLEIRPTTGRKHQIRVQLAAAGWPIVGDGRYGSSRKFPRGIALHSYSLNIRHPTQNRDIRFATPPPKTWKLKRNGLN